MKSKRQQYIVNRVAGDSNVTIELLANELNVSEMTVRRDLKELEEKEQIIRTSHSILLKDSFLNEVPFVKTACEYRRKDWLPKSNAVY